MPRATTTRVWKRPHGRRSRRAGISVATTPLASALGALTPGLMSASAFPCIAEELLRAQALVGGVGRKKIRQGKGAPQQGHRMMAPGELRPGANGEPVDFQCSGQQQRGQSEGLVKPGGKIIA